MTAIDLIPVEADGFHAFADAFALDQNWLVFISMAGHKDALKAIRAKLFTNRWLSAGNHDMSLLPRGKYVTATRTLPSGTHHMAIYIKHEDSAAEDHYALTMDRTVLEPDLYFQAHVKNSALPIHPSWKAWLYARATKNKELESLTAHRITGIKIHLDDQNLARDITRALKKGVLKKDIE